MCSDPGCETPVKYIDGGVRGKCTKHGGFPSCASCGVFCVSKKGSKCSYCCPGSLIAKRAKKEEEQIAELLSSNSIVYQREVRIDYRCMDVSKSCARLDFVIELAHQRVILEVDEHQHQTVTYSVQCDVSRMMHVMGAIACDANVRPTLWIRFNPHGFTVDGVPCRVARLKKYRALLDVLTDPTPQTGMRIRHMFYDVAMGIPVLYNEGAYDPLRDMLTISLGN